MKKSKSYYEEFKDLSKEDLGLFFVNACFTGELERIRYILTSPELKMHADIHDRGDHGLHSACQAGNLEIVRYLLTSPELKEHANIHAQNDWALTSAIKSGYLDIVKYLLSSPELKDHAHVYSNGNYSLIHACEKGHLDIVKYLLNSTALKEHPKFRDTKDPLFTPFVIAYKHNHIDIIQYFIVEFDIEISFKVKEYFETYPNEVIEKIISAKELNRKLKEEFDSDYNYGYNHTQQSSKLSKPPKI